MVFSVKKALAAACAAAVLIAVLTGCGGQKEAPKADGKVGGKIMIYTSIYPDIIDMVKPVIKKSLPALEVDWFQGGTEKVIAKMAGEMEAKKIAADALMVADPSYYYTLKDQKLLLDYASPAAKDVIIEKDKDGAWTPVRISNMIIAYNTSKLKPEDAPKTWQDLTDPKWKGKIAMPNPLLSGTAFVAAAALSEKYGWEYFEKLKANGLRVEEGNSAIQNKLLTGEYLAVMILEENILKMIETKKEPVKVVYPDDGVIVVPSPIGVMAASKNPAGAKAAVDWWLSKAGQETIVTGWMHSVRGDVKPPNGAPALNTFYGKAMKTDWVKFSKEKEKYKEEFRARVMEK